MRPILLDVRTPQEYAEGHLPGALLVPTRVPPDTDWTSVTNDLHTIMGGKFFETPVHVYCKKGIRSGHVVNILRQMGFYNATSLGGIEEGTLKSELDRGIRKLVQ